MKHPVLVASALANLALLAVFAFRPTLAPPVMRDALTRFLPIASAPAAAPVPAKTSPPRAAAAPEKGQLWSKLATDDLRSLIGRLQAAGFPPDVIRAVLMAEVASRYDPRIRALQSSDPNLPFWRQTMNPLSDPKRREAYNALQQERNRVLRELFRDPRLSDPNAATSANRPAWAAHLSSQQVDLIQQIEQDYNEMMNNARNSAINIMLPEDRQALALLQREKQADLASILSPEQLADYELRTSPITRTIGSRLGNFEPSDAEYRSIFNTYQALSQKYPGGLPTLQADRQALTEQVATQLQSSLGEARYAEYIRETSNEFQLLNRLARQEKLAPTAALETYQLRDKVEFEANRIFDEPAMTVESKRAALQQLAQNTRSQIAATLGPVAGPAYESSAGNWLTNLDNGVVVTTTKSPIVLISTGTGTSSFPGSASSSARGLPRPAPPSATPTR